MPTAESEKRSHLDEIVLWYMDKLAREPEQSRLRRFKRTSKRHPDSAKVEAAAYSALSLMDLSPTHHEHPSKGGADFLVTARDESKAVVEVTALGNEAVAALSGIPSELSETTAFFASTIRTMLLNRTAKKAKQLRGEPVPRVLFIGSSHPASVVLLGSLAAEEILLGPEEVHMSVGPSGAVGEPTCQPDVTRSTFLGVRDGKIRPRLSDVSAILLAAIDAVGCHLLGVRHPLPAVPLPQGLFPQIPFAVLRRGREGELSVEWVVGSPDAYACPFNVAMRVDAISSHFRRHIRTDPQSSRPGRK